MKIGLIGAENYHSRAFAGLFQQEKRFPGFEIDCIYGEDDPVKCEAVLREFGIAHRCGSEAEVIERSDAVMITYRRGDAHAAPAIAALEAGKPAFVDKPFTADLAQAEAVVAAARRTGTPFCGGSTLKAMPLIGELRGKVRPGAVVTIDYNADPESPYGGFFYYSPHAVELAMALCGRQPLEVAATRTGGTVITNLLYPHCQCVLVTSPIKEKLDIRITTNLVEDFPIDDSMGYRYGAEEFVEMVASGRAARDYDFYLDSVRLTERITACYEGHTAQSGK